MNYILPTVPKAIPMSQASGIVSTRDFADIEKLTGEDAALMVLKRSIPLGLTDWLSQLPKEHLKDIHILARHTDASAALNAALDASGIARSSQRTALVSDVARLCSVFSQVLEDDWIDIRLKRLEDNGCRRFHLDNMTYRLVTTYLGPATQWVLPDNAEQALKDQSDYTGPIAQFDPDDVAVFKGQQAMTGRGIVHRSPPIEGTGHSRILLCLSPPYGASPDPWTA